MIGIDERAFTSMVVALLVAGALIAAALIFGVPWLWELVKPWLHEVTA